MNLPPRPASYSGQCIRTPPPNASQRSSSANSGRLNRTLPPLPSRMRSCSAKSLRLPCSPPTQPALSRSASAMELPASKLFSESAEPNVSPVPVSLAEDGGSKRFFGDLPASKLFPESADPSGVIPMNASFPEVEGTKRGLRDPDTIRQALGLASEPGSQDLAAQQAVYERMKTVLSGLQSEYTGKLDALLRQAQIEAKVMLQANSEELLPQSDPVSTVGVRSDVLPKSGQGLFGQNATVQEGLHRSAADLSNAGPVLSSESCQLEFPLGKENVTLSAIQVDQEASSEHESDAMELSDTDGPALGCDGVDRYRSRIGYDGVSEHASASTHEANATHAATNLSDADGAPLVLEHARSSTHEANATHASSTREKLEVDPVPAAAAVQAPPSKAQKPRTKGGVSKRAKKSKCRDGIICTKTVQFEGCTAVRCAISVKDEVWTADWSGKTHIRDREDFHKIKDELPLSGLVWCLVAVRARVPMVWVGQEQAGICVFNAKNREQLCTLTGGHSGSVIAFATAPGPDGRLDVWSASNDFSIRCWHVDSGKAKAGAFALPTSPPLHIRRGIAYHGHSNSVRCLLHVGPSLWSGSDDKSICLWKCSDGERQEVIEEAHDAGVVCLVIAGRGVWSSGYDGRIREWSIGGNRRSCMREITIGLNEPLRTLLPIGRHIWVCGKSKNIVIYSEDMEQVDLLEGHSSFISSLCLVDQVEHRTIWSSSLGDHSLKVWRHTLRDAGTSIAELAAANKLYQEENWAAGEKLESAENAAAAARSEILLASQEFSKELNEALRRAAEAEEARTAAEALHAAATKSETEVQEKIRAMQADLDAKEAARLLAVKQAGECLAASQAAQSNLERSNQALAEMQQETEQLRAALASQSNQITDLQKKLDISESTLESETSGIQDLRQRLEASEAETRRILEAFAKECQRSTELESQLEEVHIRSSQFEQELGQLSEREQQLRLRYAELDIFKLDVIARELKSIDRQIDTLRGETRSFLEVAKKFSNFSDQQSSVKCASFFSESASSLRGHIRDVIERCLSETQKFHIGAPLQDPTAAGVLQSGGKISGYVVAVAEDTPLALVGNTHPRQQDEVRRDRRETG